MREIRSAPRKTPTRNQHPRWYDDCCPNSTDHARSRFDYEFSSKLIDSHGKFVGLSGTGVRQGYLLSNILYFLIPFTTQLHKTSAYLIDMNSVFRQLTLTFLLQQSLQ